MKKSNYRYLNVDDECSKTPNTPKSRVDSAARLFSERHAEIQKIIRVFIRDEQEREEVYQDLFLYFVRKPIPDEVEYVGAWLYRTILDRVRDRKRKQSRYATRLRSYAEQQIRQSSDTDNPPSSEDYEPLFRLIRETLSNTEADVVVYRYKHGMELDAIAEKMNVNTRSITHYLSSARRKLRTLIGKKKDSK